MVVAVILNGGGFQALAVVEKLCTVRPRCDGRQDVVLAVEADEDEGKAEDENQAEGTRQALQHDETFFGRLQEVLAKCSILEKENQH